MGGGFSPGHHIPDPHPLSTNDASNPPSLHESRGSLRLFSKTGSQYCSATLCASNSDSRRGVVGPFGHIAKKLRRAFRVSFNFLCLIDR